MRAKRVSYFLNETRYSGREAKSDDTGRIEFQGKKFKPKKREEESNFMDIEEDDLSPKEKKEYDRLEDQIIEIRDELSGEESNLIQLKQELKGIKSGTQEKQMEAEDWGGQIIRKYGDKVFDLVNAGYDNETKLQELKELGVDQKSARDLLDNYEYYYGEEDETEIQEIKNQIKKQKEVIDKLQNKEERLIRDQMDMLRKQKPETPSEFESEDFIF